MLVLSVKSSTYLQSSPASPDSGFSMDHSSSALKFLEHAIQQDLEEGQDPLGRLQGLCSFTGCLK